MQDDWTVVYESPSPKACSERALVLLSLSIPYQLLTDQAQTALVVPASFAERAKYELWQYRQENQPPPKAPPRPVIQYQDGLSGAFAYVAVICLFAWFSATGSFGVDWLGAGRVDGALIRAGEWWRTFTALTLHSGLRHLLGNIGFGALFGALAGRLVGSGVAWLCIVLASGLANAINTILLESAHRSIGASTAVFAALGLVAGFVWRARLMAQDRWPYRVGPIVGGIALLAYTGTGDANTDIGAHLAGFVCGFGGGMLVTLLDKYLHRPGLQPASGVLALVLLGFAWFMALLGSDSPLLPG